MLYGLDGKTLNITLNERGNIDVKGLEQYDQKTLERVRSFFKIWKPELIQKIKAGIEVEPMHHLQNNEIINIKKEKINNEEVNSINARDLHEFLDIKKDFSNWVKAQIKRGRFQENRDFIIFTQKGGYKKPLTEYAFTLDAGKHIAMMSGTERGFKAREYFIECERKLKENDQIKLPQTFAQALRLAADQAEIIESQKQVIAESKPKVDYVDKILKSKSLVTVTQIAKDYGLTASQLNKILAENKIQYKQSMQWLLYKDYANKSFTQSETFDYKDNDGNIKTGLNTKWTIKGRLFIHDLLKELNIHPNIETLEE